MRDGHVCEKPKGSGRWYAVISAKDEANGKRKRHWHALKGCSSKSEAAKRCRELLSAQDKGLYVEPNKTDLAAFSARWLTHIKMHVSPRTHERYGEIVGDNILPLLGKTVLTKLRPEQISAAYAKALESGRRDGKGGLAPRTVHHMHRILRQMLEQAVKWQILARNPADAVDAPKVERKEMRTYDVPQTVAMMDALRDTRMYVPAILAGLCAMRRGEIVALRWRNVDLDGAYLSIAASAEQTGAGVRYKEAKTGKGRKVDLSPIAVEALRAWRAKQAQEFLRLGVRPTGDTFVVTQATGEPLQPRSITHEWTRLRKAKGLARIRFHDLRHTHATHLLASGVHPKIAQERLGHSSIAITLDLYSHVLPSLQGDAVAKVDTALQAAMTGKNQRR